MMNKIFIIVAIFVAIIFFTGLDIDSDSNKKTVSNDTIPQSIHGINLENEYLFSGERVPIEKQDVYERMDRELLVNTFWHSSTILNIKRSKKYFPLIERILKEEGIPDDFKYLCVAESNLSNAVSPAGAYGFWQFLKSTGQSYGLEVNKYVDERFHLEKSTRAACQYLKKAKSEFGSWTLAAISYNMGMTGLRKQLKLQETRSLYDLNLNTETMRYVFRIVALKTIISTPEKFGIQLSENQYYQPLDKVYYMSLDTSIQNIAKFAAKYGASYRDIKYYNPWLISHILPNTSRKKYTVKIPKNS